MGLWQQLLEWLQSIFYKKEMELTIVGLPAAGKSTLVNVITSGDGTEDTIPTVGFNRRTVKKGNVSINLWDVGGQRKSMWERYCRNVGAIVYVMDASNKDTFEDAAKELHELMSKKTLNDIPLLVLGNKNDIEGAISSEEMAKVLQLEKIQSHMVSSYSISAKNNVNINKVIDWLIKHGKTKSSS
mmetsp:Transcript_8251/g.12224  ORF Transcript_8251/g.12224 Transcript_8251/m.12224 type:complete len:185 (+) Transcript_8251:48-602(+)